MKDRPLRIGELAAKANVSIATLRYYERRGLIHPDRTSSGYRTYAPSVVDDVRWIKSAQGIGFRLREIEALLRQREDPKATCVQVCDVLADKLVEIDERARALAAQAAALRNVLEQCDMSDRPAGECPVWKELETGVDER